MVEVERIRCGMVNCWLLKEGGSCILVDTAVSHFRDLLLDRLKKENLRLILLTHGHTDHTGNAAAIAKALGAPIAMHEADVEMADGSKPRELYADNLLGRMILAGTARSVYRPAGFSVEEMFAGGESLEAYGIPGANIGALPGHTKGSIGVLTDDGQFIVGDVMMNILKPTKARMYEDIAALKRSVDIIKDSGCDTIMTGHGNPFAAGEFFKNR